MQNFGDICNITASDVPPAEVVIGGSPCQNLSIAGNRQGLEGNESRLFLEQIRLIKEMRKRYGKTRWMVWENVPGALTANQKNNRAQTETQNANVARNLESQFGL